MTKTTIFLPCGHATVVSHTQKEKVIFCRQYKCNMAASVKPVQEITYIVSEMPPTLLSEVTV